MRKQANLRQGKHRTTEKKKKTIAEQKVTEQPENDYKLTM